MSNEQKENPSTTPDTEDRELTAEQLDEVAGANTVGGTNHKAGTQ